MCLKLWINANKQKQMQHNKKGVKVFFIILSVIQF